MSKKNNDLSCHSAKEMDFYLLDADLLQSIKKAERGCLESQEALYFAFSNGEKAKTDYRRAKYYLTKSFENCSKGDENLETKIIILENAVLLEMKKGDVDGMEKEHKNLISFLIRKNITLKDWPHDTIKMISEIYLKSQ